jgi:hypothetical protein
MADIKAHFKLNEGKYVLHSEKALGLVPFLSRRTTRLVVATLHGGAEEGMYMVFNVGDYLHVAPFDSTDKVGLHIEIRLGWHAVAAAGGRCVVAVGGACPRQRAW